MKLLTKSLIAGAVALASVSSFATTSASGVDPQGAGIAHFSGTSVGSCTAPTTTVTLNNIDFYVAANDTSGVYKHPVDLSVVCTNPNQHWSIMNHLASFSMASGVNGAVAETGYVSLTGLTAAPGEVFGAGVANMQDTDPVVAANAYDGVYAASGQGSVTKTSKLTFGKTLPGGVTSDVLYTVANSIPQGAVPTGTITGRGVFTVDVPLIIVY
jgi:hypothetical protein